MSSRDTDMHCYSKAVHAAFVDIHLLDGQVKRG